MRPGRGRAHRPHGGAGPAGDRHGAAGDRDRAGAADDRHLIALANRHLSLKQQASGGFLVGGGWFGGFDPASGRTHNLRRTIEGNLWVCARALPALRGLSCVRAWTGINPAIDRAPILGEAPGLPGFFNAVTANGYTLGPVIGRITADARARRAGRSMLSAGAVRMSSDPCHVWPARIRWPG